MTGEEFSVSQTCDPTSRSEISCGVQYSNQRTADHRVTHSVCRMRHCSPVPRHDGTLFNGADTSLRFRPLACRRRDWASCCERPSCLLPGLDDPTSPLALGALPEHDVPAIATGEGDCRGEGEQGKLFHSLTHHLPSIPLRDFDEGCGHVHGKDLVDAAPVRSD